MKKSKLVVISAVALVVIVAVAFVGIRLKIETAVCVKASDGSMLYISEKTDEPVVMLGNVKNIGKVSTGDKAIVVYDKAIMKTYPAQTKVYLCIKIKSDYKEITAESYPELAQMGWINGGNLSNEVAFKYARFEIPENWKSEEMMMTGYYYCDMDVKKLSPKEEYENGYMILAHYPRNSFNVAKNKLTESEITLANGMKAKVGYYEGNEDWKYVVISDSDGYVYENKGLNHEDSLIALEIINSTTFA